MTVNVVYPPVVLTTAANTWQKQRMANLLEVLLVLLCIILVAQICGRIFSYLQQPAVMGEIISGLLLGPSLLGRFWPEMQRTLIPSNAVPFIGLFAQVGVVLYMFVIGLELDFSAVKKSGRSILVISFSSMILPFLLGLGFVYFMFTSLAEPNVNATGFALFFAVSMSITAFPVLARILDDSQLRKTKLGELALSCAAVDDASAWCFLAMAVSIVKAGGAGAFYPIVWTALFVLLMLLGVRPVLQKLLRGIERWNVSMQSCLTLLLTGALVSAVITEWIGIHAIFGAFVFGAIVPHDSKIAIAAIERLQDFVKILFLPAFFAFTGMRTQVSLLSGFNDWMLCLAIIALATCGKFLGSYLAARAVGQDAKQAGALGALLNSRGLVELIVLNIGLDLGIISPRLFTMLVIMAIVTTLMATPLTFGILQIPRKNVHSWKNL
jgi:Kef-type K+ transport system membrane component KefB